MPTDTKVNDLIINVLTEEQYASIPTASVSLTELYLVPEVIDTVPISGSSNPITSGGVYDAIQEIPEQVNADWNATSGPAQILNKPDINPTNPSNNQVLIYSSSNSQWVNSSLYWADLPIQIASNKTTSPTFGDVRVSENDLYIGASTASQCHQQYDASLQCLKFIFD